MPDRTSITTDAAGRRVMAKVGLTGEEGARLAREAELLDAARHPGVVDLVGVDGSGVGSMLLTAHVEGPTLSAVGPLPLEEGAGLLAALATTLADLHELGLVHGSVAPEHVIVGPGGRPVLCGLAYGGRAGEPVGPTPAVMSGFADPVRAEAVVQSPAFDIYAIGALARFLAPDPPPGHVLSTVAAEAMDDDAGARPSARALAQAIQAAVPTARLPRGLASPATAPGRPAPARLSPAPADPLAALRRAGAGGRRPARPRVSVALGAVAAAGAVVAAVLVAGSAAQGPAPELSTPVVAVPDPDPPHEAEPGPTTTRAGLTSSSSSSSTSTTALAATSRRDCPVAPAVLQADVDGDGCPDPLRYNDGLLEAGEARWALGQAGDQVATGNWGCQGTRTVALFRPSTGEIFRFDGWATPGVDLKATAVARVQGGLALRAADVDRDGCHEAVVERASGTPEVIRLPRMAP